MSRPDHHVLGNIEAPQLYELRINGASVEQSANNVDLYWKARRAVNGKPGIYAEVESISGFFVSCIFSDETLRDWERA